MRKLLALAVLVLGVVVVASATAGQPVIVSEDVDDTFLDEFLTDACGFDVTTHAQGHIITREFDRETGTLVVRTLSVALTATAHGKTYRFRDVGADQVRVTKEGAILSIVGQVPFDFIGVLKINLDTDEITHEPSKNISGRVDDACAKLAA